MKSHPTIDKMIDDNLFLCPIRQVKGDDAYYSISKDEIVVPTHEQFVDGEAFATTIDATIRELIIKLRRLDMRPLSRPEKQHISIG